MSIAIQELIDQIQPEKTILIFGVGASVPSNAPNVGALVEAISSEFEIEAEGLGLSEISSLAENKRNRTDLIKLIRRKFSGLKAKGALLNLPNHAWKGIYTINYNELVEDTYQRAKKPLTVFSSDFDYKARHDPDPDGLRLHERVSRGALCTPERRTQPWIASSLNRPGFELTPRSWTVGS